MSLEPNLFPAILSPLVEVIASACPLGKEEQASLVAKGFEISPSLARAVAKRQEEYRAGRYCALQALARLGYGASAELGILPDYAPAWPSGYVGSIAHSHGRAAAAVARATDVAGIGIDMEPVLSEQRASNVRHMILTSEDERTVSRLEGWAEGERVTLVFSAKEAIYKCLRPLCGQYFGFADAQLDEVDASAGTFRFRLIKKIGSAFDEGWAGQGRFARGGGWVHAAMELTK